MTKKVLLIGIAVLIIGLLVVSLTSAQETPDATSGVSWVDSDGDGVCDLSGSETTAYQYGNGQRARYASDDPAAVPGSDFMDEDGDGVCDHQAAAMGGQATLGQRARGGGGNGQRGHGNNGGAP